MNYQGGEAGGVRIITYKSNLLTFVQILHMLVLLFPEHMTVYIFHKKPSNWLAQKHYEDLYHSNWDWAIFTHLYRVARRKGAARKVCPQGIEKIIYPANLIFQDGIDMAGIKPAWFLPLVSLALGGISPWLVGVVLWIWRRKRVPP